MAPARRANGVASAARVTLGTVCVGAICVRNVSAIVGRKGAMAESLMGMSFLKNVGMRMEGNELAFYQYR
jgi:aspartyl protease family protein